MSKMKRALFLADMHYPLTIPAVMDLSNPKADTPLMNFIKDYDPHIIDDLGDFLDLGCVSHWNKSNARERENRRLKKDYDFCNRWLDKLEANAKSMERHIRHEGNHEQWIEDTLDIDPVLEGMLEVSENLNFAERGVEWIRSGKHAKIGKLYSIHGNYKKGYLPAFPASAIHKLYARNIICGHFHQNQTFSGSTPFDMDAHQVTILGSLANVNPIWRKNEASNWSNSFATAEIEPSGIFHLRVINIIKGRFVYDGNVYQ